MSVKLLSFVAQQQRVVYEALIFYPQIAFGSVMLKYISLIWKQKLINCASINLDELCFVI